MEKANILFYSIFLEDEGIKPLEFKRTEVERVSESIEIIGKCESGAVVLRVIPTGMLLAVNGYAGVTEDIEDIGIHLVDEFDFDANASSCRTIRITKDTYQIDAEQFKVGMYRNIRDIREYLNKEEFMSVLEQI